MAKTKPVRTRVPPHDFSPDPDMPLEPLSPAEIRNGKTPRSYCRHCRLPGEPGDERHPVAALPPVPRQQLQDWRAWDAARTGERTDV